MLLLYATAELEELTCKLYGSKTKDINELRYATFCAKFEKIESHKLQPCRDSLKTHILRANYQGFAWSRCPEQ